MDQKNLLLAIIASLGILLAFEVFVGGPQRERLAQQQQAQEAAQQAEEMDTRPTAGLAPGMRDDEDLLRQPEALEQVLRGDVPEGTRQAILEETPRVPIVTPTLRGSISLIGGRLDDLVLTRYRETIEEDSPQIKLFHPLGTARPYYADFGWTAAGADLALPGINTEWQLVEGDELAPGRPVVLRWDNGAGLVFTRRFEVDEHYLFEITQEVHNETGVAVEMAPYGLISRTGTPDTLGFFILHEGLIGVLDGTLREIKYGDLRDDGVIRDTSRGGWIGITDKYWMSTLVPDQNQEVATRFLYDGSRGVDKYQTDILYSLAPVPDGAAISQTSRLFAGAKEVMVLDNYRDNLNIDRFDLAVDFGWFYFLTKPIFLALHWLALQIGNFGVAILILTVAIKLLFFPLANKSYRAMAKMRKLQPEMLKLRERFGDDKQRLNQEMMALYKREKANPVSGCLPILIQIPVFFALYKVLFVTIEMRHAPFFGWIQDLSAPDPTSILNLFGLLPYTVPDLGLLNIISIGIWPILMGISMYLQQLLNPQPPDPLQAKIFLALPIVFTFVLAGFPAGLVIYWTWNNLLSILQQYVIMRRAGVPIGRKAELAVSTAFGGGGRAEGKSSAREDGDTTRSGKPRSGNGLTEEPARSTPTNGAASDEEAETGGSSAQDDVEREAPSDGGKAAAKAKASGGGRKGGGRRRSRGKSRAKAGQ